MPLSVSDTSSRTKQCGMHNSPKNRGESFFCALRAGHKGHCAPYPYQTEAQILAEQLASKRAPSGVIPDPAMLRYHLAILHLEDELRAGEITMADIAPAVQSGDLSVEDFCEISQKFKKAY